MLRWQWKTLNDERDMAKYAGLIVPLVSLCYIIQLYKTLGSQCLALARHAYAVANISQQTC